jgi:hypothetical protein
MNSDNERKTPCYYTVNLATVRYDNRLTFFERILYSDILAMSISFGFAFPSNSYLASLYNLDIRSVKRAIKSLQKNGYIDIVIDKEKGNKRQLYIKAIPNEPFLIPLVTKMSLPSDKNVTTLVTKMSLPSDKNVPYNNILNNIPNNISNNRAIARYNTMDSSSKNSKTKRKNNAPDVEIDWFEKYLEESKQNDQKNRSEIEALIGE